MRRVLVLFLVAVPLVAAPRVRVVRSEPTTAAAWLMQHAFATGSPDGLQAAVDSLPAASIYALGDATHGTHEFFESKRALIPLLAATRGVKTITIEAPVSEWELVRNAVLSGRDIAPLLESVDFFFWDTDELLALLAQLQLAGGFEVVGVDASHPHPVIDRLLEEVDAGTADAIRQRCSCLEDYRNSPGSYAISAGRTECRASVATVRPLLDSRRTTLVALLGDDGFERALHLARVLEQGEESLATGGANRDAAMAENVAWVARHSASPIVFWAHDEHVGRVPYQLEDAPVTTSAGTLLAEQYGEEYFAVASVALDGRFNAVDYAEGAGVIRERNMPAPRADDLAILLARRGLDAMYVPLRNAPSVMRGEFTMRIAGSNVASVAVPTLTVRVPLPEKFDGVLYWRATTPSRLRRYPVIR